VSPAAHTTHAFAPRPHASAFVPSWQASFASQQPVQFDTLHFFPGTGMAPHAETMSTQATAMTNERWN
jgi:hypothetical protein